MSESSTLVYVILGAAGSQRRAVLADLLEAGFAGKADSTLTLLSADEVPSEHDTRLGRVERWTLREGQIVVPEMATSEETIFFVTDGRANPVDQIEALKTWLEQTGRELARILCVVNCRLAEQHRELLVWYDACIHFSDVVLLAEREGVANKWMSDFQARYKDKFFPCLFDLVKGGRIKNPALVLEPEARRVSHFFDEPDWEILDEEEEDEEEDRDSNEEVEVKEEVDPYIERRLGGRRVKEIPDVASFLPGESRR